jgi:hypothetical protein
VTMLRAFVIALGAILACVGIALIARGAPVPGWQVLGIGLIVLIGTLFERWRYRRTDEGPVGQWKSTGEQFLDPSTGDPIEVLFDPHTGERRYVSGKLSGRGDPPP